MTAHRITLSYPVSVNKMYIRAKGGGVILSPEARAWKESAGWEAIAQVGRLELKGDISLTVHFYALPGADIDNILKCTQDALNKIIWEDDEQITQLHVYKYRNADQPRIELEIRGIEHVVSK